MTTSETATWSQLELSGDIPPERAAHAVAVHDNDMYVFGGMNTSGALNDFYVFHTGKIYFYIFSYVKTLISSLRFLTLISI